MVLQRHQLPTKMQVWARMKKFQKNAALTVENVLRSEEKKLVSIKYGTPEEAAKAMASLEQMPVIFFAKRVPPLSNARLRRNAVSGFEHVMALVARLRAARTWL